MKLARQQILMVSLGQLIYSTTTRAEHNLSTRLMLRALCHGLRSGIDLQFVLFSSDAVIAIWSIACPYLYLKDNS